MFRVQADKYGLKKYHVDITRIFKVQIPNKGLDVSDASRSNEKPAHLTSNIQSELQNVREFLMLSQKCILVFGCKCHLHIQH